MRNLFEGLVCFVVPGRQNLTIGVIVRKVSKYIFFPCRKL